MERGQARNRRRYTDARLEVDGGQIRRERFGPRQLASLVLTAAIIGVPMPLLAKRVVCIDVAKDDQEMPIEDGYLTTHEGWERSRARPGDVIVLGGDLTDCLGNVADGDTLVIIAHGVSGSGGAGEAFTWCDEQFSDFGNGTGEMPVPAGFDMRQDVTVDFCTCWSSNDPDDYLGADVPLTEKILTALGGHASNMAMGFMGTAVSAATFRYPYPAGLPQALEADYSAFVDACLMDDESWLDKAPVNRSDPAPVPDHQSCAQAIVDACFETLPPGHPLVGQPSPQIQVRYGRPTDSEADRSSLLLGRIGLPMTSCGEVALSSEPILFADGFELGNTDAWSAVVP